MPVIQAKQYIPKVETLNAGNVQQELGKANLGTELSAKEAKWLNDVFAKFGSDPSVKDSLSRLMQGVKVSDANKPKVATTLAQLIGTAGTPGGTTTTASGGPLAMKVPAAVAHLVVDANGPKGVSVAVAKRLSTATDLSNLKEGGDLFKGFLQLNIGDMLAGKPELKPLSDALKGGLTVQTPHNQVQVEPGKMGNPVVFYGNDHKEVAELIHAIAAEKPGIFHKAMLHYEQAHVAGGPKAFFADDAVVMGSTHGGVLVPVIDENGKKDIAWIDWPTDYGRLPTGNDATYCARLGIDAIDNLKFDAPLPADWKERVRAYTDWQQTMGVLSMITVPFASGDSRPWNSNYKFNLLEVSDADKARSFFNVVSSPGAAATQQAAKGMSQYCREGAETMTNAREATFKTLSPEAQKSLEEMDAIVKAAGGDTPGKAHLGWKALAAKGKITAEQLNTLETTRTINVPFNLGRKDLEPISSYKPQGIQTDPGIGQGLSADPVHMAGLVGGLMEVNFNRTRTSEAIANQLGDALKAAAASGGAAAAGQLLGIAAAVAGLDPQSAADPSKHQKIMDAFGDKMHTELLVGVLQNPEIQTKIKSSIAYEHMDTTSKGRIDKLFTAYIDLVKSGPSMSDADFRKAQRNLDAKSESTQITYGPPINRTDAMMVFVPPQYDIFLAHGAGGANKPGYQPIAEMLAKGWQK